MYRQRVQRFLAEWKGSLLFLLLMVVFRSSIADWNVVPTGSMKPTILEGDTVWVNKLAYDFKLPFSSTRLAILGDPQRGDIVVFTSPHDGTRLIKRLIGLPGDVVAVVNNQLFINNEAAGYVAASADVLQQLHAEDERLAVERQENIQGIRHPVRFLPLHSSPLANFAPRRVPDSHYFMLGDNRDNSGDSRFFGMVPRENLIGRASTVLLSLNPTHYYLPRTQRFLYSLP